jgi:Reverse transcriptase (RNA-dependent DNA polymerase)/gag-polypeptide of LTR copia-type/Integrase core domain
MSRKQSDIEPRVVFKTRALTKTNYRLWSITMLVHLKVMKLSHLIEETYDRESATEDIRRKDDEFMSVLLNHVSDEIAGEVAEEETGRAIWFRLKKMFTMTEYNMQHLFHKFTESKLSAGKSVAEWVAELNNLRSDLAVAGKKLDNVDMNGTLLRGARARFPNMVGNLQSQSNLTPEYIVNKLKEEEERNDVNEVENGSMDERALYVSKHRPQYKNKWTNERKKNETRILRCFTCNKPGHFQKNCRFNKKNQQKTQESVFANRLKSNVGEEIIRDTWGLDSGATSHITGDRDCFIRYEQMKPKEIEFANGQSNNAIGKGDVAIKLDSGQTITIQDVLHVPGILHNLLSTSKLEKIGLYFQHRPKGVFLVNKKNEIVTQACLMMEGDMYRVKKLEANKECCNVITLKSNDPVQSWHEKFCHVSATTLIALNKKYQLEGMENVTPEQIKSVSECEACIMGKSRRTAMPKKATTRSTKPLELIHSDLCGPMSTPSIGGFRYFIIFVDDYSRYTVIAFLRNKSEALEEFKKFSHRAERLTGEKIKEFRTDRGMEFLSNEFSTYLAQNGIKRQLTPSYTPEHNGVSERMNQTIVGLARSMLVGAGLSHNFWAEAAATACYVRNRCTTSALDNGKTPYEAYFNKVPNINDLKVFGSIAYAHIPKEKRKKLDNRAIKCVFLGYPEESKAYRLMELGSRKIIISRDVTFISQKLMIQQEGDSVIESKQDVFNSTPELNEDQGTKSKEDLYETFLDQEQEISEETEPKPALYDEFKKIQSGKSGNYGSTTNVKGNRRSQRVNNRVSLVRVMPERVLLSLARIEPTSYKEAINSDNHEMWEKAMDLEYNAIVDADTWDLVDKPKHCRTVGCKWVFKIKENSDGSISRYKARLVAKGYTQQEGIDYYETFAPVAKFQSIRGLLAIGAHHDYEIHQMDVVSAFLNGDIDAEVYMEQPEGYITKGNEEKVCKLKKCLYGLKQASKAWYEKIDATLKQLNFSSLDADTCIYSLHEGDTVIYIALYVDDLLILTNSKSKLDSVKDYLGQQFQMKDLGEVQNVLGLQINRDRRNRRLTISQEKYVRDMLKRFSLDQCKSVRTPLEPNSKLCRTEDGETCDDVKLYQSMVGSLLYAMRGTRPDIGYAVTKLSQFCSNPSHIHLIAVKRVMRYLQGTKEYKLHYGTSDNQILELVGYSDADWANDVDSRRSITGYVFMLGNNIISWATKAQPTVALSTVEAEYMAAAQAAQECIWWRNFLAKLRMKITTPTTILDDNQGAIALAKHPGYHARTKHIDIRHHFIREQIDAENIKLEYIPTSEMIADQLTKPLPAAQHEKLVGLMQLM